MKVNRKAPVAIRTAGQIVLGVVTIVPYTLMQFFTVLFMIASLFEGIDSGYSTIVICMCLFDLMYVLHFYVSSKAERVVRMILTCALALFTFAQLGVGICSVGIPATKNADVMFVWGFLALKLVLPFVLVSLNRRANKLAAEAGCQTAE